MEPIIKRYDLKGATLAENTISGAAAVMGNVDRGGDVIAPGAFKGLAREFLTSGFVAFGHDWQAPPIAMPTSLKEDGAQLVSTAEFHSTPAAQEVRTIAAERLSRGLSVGLSIGFYAAPDDMAYYDSGPALLKAFEADGVDVTLYDVPGVKAHRAPVRLIRRVAELYEWSVVPAPMNPRATATAVKAIARDVTTEREFEAFLRDAGYSRAQAVAITLHGYKAGRDASDTDPQREAAAAELQAAARAAHARFLAATIPMGE